MLYWILGFIVLLVILAVIFAKNPKEVIIDEVELSESLELEDESFFDVIIVGAGLSGISAAHTLITRCSKKSYVILENRSSVGGTWDLFKYPGIRSDSDMFTLGFSHKPWFKKKPIAEGGDIRKYIRLVAKERHIDEHISYEKQLVSADFDSSSKKWKLTVHDNVKNTNFTISCNVLQMCTGYYDYEKPYRPQFEGEESFKGDIIHPQLWKEDYDYSDKNIVIIGSGATAITLLPNLADKAKHVTMLQRTPSFILPLPQDSKFVDILQKYFPEKFAYFCIRWRNISVSWFLYTFCKAFPAYSKKQLIKTMKKLLPENLDIKHVTPPYNPWEQRLCISPDADIFKCIRKGKASIETDHIDRFVENGILLKSGETLECDTIVTATGLNIRVFGGAKLSIDGKEIKMSEKFLYRGMMLDNVPNLFFYGGYTNASWTLRCEITSEWAARYMNQMDKTNSSICYPHLPSEHGMKPKNGFDLDSGYIKRGRHLLPNLGDKGAWGNYAFFPDLWGFTTGKAEDGVMKFE